MAQRFQGKKSKAMSRKDPAKQIGGDKKVKVKVEMTKPYAQLDDFDNKILRMMIEYPEATYKDIATSTGNKLSAYQVSERVKRPAFKKALDDVRASAWDIICRAQGIAARKLMRWINSDDAKISLRAIEIALKPLIEAPPIINNNSFYQMVHEVKFGEEGQIYKTVKSVGQDSQAQMDRSNFVKPSELLIQEAE